MPEPTTRERIALALADLPDRFRRRWCKPGRYGCCCVGCANARVRALGLGEAQWRDWVESLPPAEEPGQR